MAKEDSSAKLPATLSSAWKGSTWSQQICRLVSVGFECFDVLDLGYIAYLPLVNVIRVPRLVPLVGGRHVESRGGSCDLRR